MLNQAYDIIIIGSGPAGMTAAVYAQRAGKSTLVLEKTAFGGQITHSPKVENYPGFLEMSGNEFAEKLMDQALNQGAEIELAEAQRIVSTDGGFTVVTDAGDFFGKAVILATGSKHRTLGLDREEELVGNGVSYCAVCDGAFYAGRDIAVIGGGNSALQEIILLADRCAHITVVQNLAFLTGEQKLMEKVQQLPNVDIIYNTVVVGLLGDDELTGIQLKNEQTGEESVLNCDGIFVAIGQVPENEPFQDVVALNEYGYIFSGEDCLTTTEGIFVAGDCRTKAVRQITTATGDGAVAAVAACRYLDR